ncbi:hypothetical protein CWC18_12040 [Pseudoalteromonas aurantia]|uniref:helix-turn-helix domain-containing protein n=1 Tax=Pseudoalteromonas aurantia TaxID=43654 RepID=UPI00110A46AF|nr:helix-turn-helix transcriptional regulator [Pseudoalteromonas aurantia]TMO61243.1 hypothetical protein CWC18_12040 [Pseudoalteromonas aurantia]
MLDGSDLKSVRKNAGISQTDMAKKLNCDRRTIINYEQGVCEPKASQLFRWLDVCKIDLKPLAAQLRNIKESILIFLSLVIISPYIIIYFYISALISFSIYGLIRREENISCIAFIIASLCTFEFISIGYFDSFISSLTTDDLIIAIFYYSFQITFSMAGYYIFSYRIKKRHQIHIENLKLSLLEKALPKIYIYNSIITTVHLIDFYINNKYSYTFLSMFYTYYEHLVYIGMSLIIFTLAAMVASHEKELRRLRPPLTP